MKTDRRAFLQLAGVAPASMMPGVAAAAVARGETPVGELDRAAFAPLVGDEFVFETSAVEKCAARLLSVENLAHKSARPDPQRAFRLRFEAGPGERLEERTYSVAHPRLGRFALFVSPNDARGRIVEAIFNRL